MEQTEHSSEMTPSAKGKKDKPDKIARGRAKETLFRVSARNQIEMIAIADNKGNMITGINVILISLIIAVFGSGVSVGGELFIHKVQLVVPFAILLFACLISAVFAILAVKPKLIKSKSGSKQTLTFFYNFFRKSLDEYIADMHGILRSRETTYDQLIIDMYHNGIVLQRKYALLSTSYTIFLTGLISSVGAYVVILFV